MNRPSLLDYRSGDTKSLICTVTGNTLAKVASAEPRDAIFDLNVRPFYGSRGRVNSDILKTCTQDQSSKFWFLNNGVTMTCDRFELITDPDTTLVRIYNAQIVNGCQTSVTIREAWERNELKLDVNILLKIYAINNPDLAERITLTTNSQNEITDRDLRANDEVQRDIQRMMADKFNYFYERKNKQYWDIRGKRRKHIVPNYRAAQAYLAIVRQKPSIARGFRGKIWSEYYNEIFSNATVEDLLLSYLIYDYCYEHGKQAKRGNITNRAEVEVIVYGVSTLRELLDIYY